MWILRAQRTFAADVFIELGIVHEAGIRAAETRSEFIAADAAPGGVMICPAGRVAGVADVKEVGEVLTEPRSAVILVRNCVDAQLGYKLVHLWQSGFMRLHPFHLVFALVEDLLNRLIGSYVVKEEAGIGDKYI